MQEVFEKIIEKIGIRAEKSEKKEMDAEHFEYAQMYKGERIAFGDAIEIVKQEAEKYNNGWIMCSERLPEEHKLYDITFKNSAGIHSDSAIYNPYLKRWLWDADETELVENEIFAWAEKREPYQPKGE